MDITIIIQGYIINEVDLITTITEYQKYGKIIISSYFENHVDLKKNILDNFPTVILIDNDINDFSSQFDKSNYNHRHCFFQISTCQKALQYVNTPYIIKTRTDNYFSNINKFIYEVINNPEKITSIQYYIRGFHNCKYHPSDILFGGSYDNITSIFNNTHNFDSNIPEVIIFKNFILQKIKNMDMDIHDVDNNIDIYAETMSKIFNVYNISNLEPYYFKNYNFNHSNVSTIDFFKHGCF
jgi:hypothetical protein